MKLKKVAALCSGSKVFRLYDKVDAEGVATQWLGDGYAIYPLHGLPFLDECSLYKMFDVSEKAQEKIYFSHDKMSEGLNVDDCSAGDTVAEDMGVTISYGGMVLLPLRTVDGILYIQSKYLGPLEDQADFLQLYVRRTGDGARYIAAKAGMMLMGIIMLYNMVNEDFVNRLDEIAALTRRELERRKHSAVPDQPTDEEQESLLEQRVEVGANEA